MNGYKRASEVADQLHINRNTLRRWLLQYEDYLNTKREGNTKFIHESSIQAIELIKECYSKQMQEHEIKDLLAKSHEIPKNVDTEEISPATPSRLEEELKEIKEMLDQQMEFNKQLVEQLNKQQKYIEERMNERDTQLMSMIRDVQDTKQALLESAATKEKKGWVSRLFGK